MFRELRSNVGTIWCSLAHESVLWPIHGQYECRTCGRHYTAFENMPAATSAGARRQSVAVQAPNHA
jgi:hypothetical protein